MVKSRHRPLVAALRWRSGRRACFYLAGRLCSYYLRGAGRPPLRSFRLRTLELFLLECDLPEIEALERELAGFSPKLFANVAAAWSLAHVESQRAAERIRRRLGF